MQGSLPTASDMQAAWLDREGVQAASHAQLASSLLALEREWGDFIARLQQAGWAPELVTIRTGSTKFSQQ